MPNRPIDGFIASQSRELLHFSDSKQVSPQLIWLDGHSATVVRVKSEAIASPRGRYGRLLPQPPHAGELTQGRRQCGEFVPDEIVADVIGD